MIPANIGHADILKAIEHVDVHGVPRNRSSTKFSILLNGKQYPPKYVISLANSYANGEELPAEVFSGGDESNSFLENLGFKIVSDAAEPDFTPIKSHSWEQLSEVTAIKHADKSSFLHNGTVIPQEIRPFFSIDVATWSQDRPLQLLLAGKPYQAKLTYSNGRTRLFWGEDFAEKLKALFPHDYNLFKNGEKPHNPPVFRFEKLGNVYEGDRVILDLVCKKDVQQDIEAEVIEDGTGQLEGAQKEYYGKRYERNPENRQKAIEIHGTRCVVCGFSFEEAYGERGRGFIEVHHTKPLYLNGQEQLVDPEKDLVPVCSNCHRMIHRRRDEVLTVDQLIEMRGAE